MNGRVTHRRLSRWFYRLGLERGIQMQSEGIVIYRSKLEQQRDQAAYEVANGIGDWIVGHPVATIGILVLFLVVSLGIMIWKDEKRMERKRRGW